ncbi:MAG: type II secretion system major pseudopilin GspG [Synergistaceae bacterium]|nr:type II secretion system major pseudopilin GspG [Synergistaceae bacterium]
MQKNVGERRGVSFDSENIKPQRRRKAFTLIEIMVVVVILGILATVATVQVVARLEEARRTTTKAQIEAFVTALDMYRLHNGVYPTTQQGLDALVKKPVTSPIPKRYPEEPYMKNIPDDPWGNPYIYRCPGERGAYDIISTGPDGEEGGEGRNADINNHDPL